MHDRELDVVVFGATGFTGKLVAEALAQRAPPDLSWGLAGRSAARLADVAHAVRGGRTPPPRIVVASVEDAASLREMASRARVVLTTVGPYAVHGLPVVDACVAAGADYVDLTGEPAFARDVLRRFDEAAREAKLRIVNACGFDSVPHDVGVLHAVRAIRPHVPIAAALSVRAYVRATGGFSGGTWHSALGIFADLGSARAAERASRDPSGRVVEKLDLGPHYADEVRSWALPMPTIDPWIVRRSARALEEYGPTFRNGHFVCTGSLARAVGTVAAVGSVVALAQVAPVRRVLGRLRKPGEGPSEEHRRRAKFSITFVAEGGGKRSVTRVSGVDRGFGETA
jgi:short subunit dehydrogenase-like uncharacterized protein